MLLKKIGDWSNLQHISVTHISNGSLHKMERKFIKWWKKLIPGRRTMTNSRHGRICENINECPPNLPQVYPELSQNVCTSSNMQQEVPVEGQGKIENNTDLSTDGCGLTCNSLDVFDESIPAMPVVSKKSAFLKTLDFDKNKLSRKISEMSIEQDTDNSGGVCGAICVKPATKVKEFDDVEFIKSEIESLKTLEANVSYAFSEEELLLLKTEVDIELNKVCPSEFYDFCLITCDEDYEEALLFRSYLCEQYNLKGCMLFDPCISSLGGDIFSQYEAMIDRSTKVFFYQTENYKNDNVHLRVQNGAVYQQLWEKMRWNREKCVPVFPHGRRKLGLALSGVSGLDPTIPENLSRSVQATFTERVRKICVLKEMDAKQKRQLLYKDLLGRMLQEYVKRKLSAREQKLGPHFKLKINDEKIPEITDSVPNMLLGQETQNEIIKAVTQSINSDSRILNKNVATEYEVCISESSDIHIGPQIEVNIHLNTSDCTNKSSDAVNSVGET